MNLRIIFIRKSNGEVELLTASIKYHGVSPRDIPIKGGDTLHSIPELSHYIKWLDMHYTGYKHYTCLLYTSPSPRDRG